MKKILHEGNYLRFISEDTWEYVERTNCKGIVIIVPMKDDKTVIFVEQYRYPVKNKVIEFPAGLVNDLDPSKNESLETAAMRELEEETGYRARRLQRFLEGPISSGMSSEKLVFFRAYGLKKVGKGGGDHTENITVHEIPLSKACSWLRRMEKKGLFVDPKVYSGLYFLEK